MKKLFAFILSVVLIFSMSATAFATEGNSYNVIQDNATTRIAEEYIDGVRYVYTFDKAKQELTTQTFGTNDSITSVKTICLANLAKAQPTNEFEFSSRASNHYQNTFLNYEYEEISSNVYELRNKNVYVYRYLPDDRDAIDNYVSAVDTLNAAELAVIATGGTAAIWAIITYFTAGLTAGEVATTVGVGLADVIALNLAVDNCQRVWRLYVE